MVLATFRERLGAAIFGADKRSVPPIAASTSPRPRAGGAGAWPGPAPHTDRATRSRWALRTGGTDPRSITPRQMVELSHRLRDSGRLSSSESELLAFQPELHPDYAATIGSLSNVPAAPDRPRDQLAEWESRLAFARTYTPEDRQRIADIHRITEALRALTAA